MAYPQRLPGHLLQVEQQQESQKHDTRYAMYYCRMLYGIAFSQIHLKPTKTRHTAPAGACRVGWMASSAAHAAAAAHTPPHRLQGHSSKQFEVNTVYEVSRIAHQFKKRTGAW
jgi:hypothetical protein